MSWYKRYPGWLHAEWQELYSNGNYKPAFTFFERTFLSCGYIIVRSDKTEYQPVLIVYPDSTPYQPPSVYLLGEAPPEELIKNLSKMSPGEIEQGIKPFIRFLYRRHQGPNGSLCFIEMEDLHREQAEFYGIRQILKRIRDWLAGFQTGRLPADSPEVELFSHFPKQLPNLTLLIPDAFFNPAFHKGRCYFSRVTPPGYDELPQVFFGVAIEGASRESIIMPLPESEKTFTYLGHHIPSENDILHRSAKLDKGLDEGIYLEGFWWTADRELEPFATGAELAGFLEPGAAGLKMLLVEEVKKGLACEEDLYIGIRFPSRSPQDRPYEWQFFRLSSEGKRAGLINPTEAELIERLGKRRVEAIRSEYVDEQTFFKRNKGIFSRETLRKSGLSLFGVGALGSEVADCLAKAGVGHLHLVDMDLLKAQNLVRHLCGSQMLYFPKVVAVAAKVSEHMHHFIQVSAFQGNVMQTAVGDLLARSSTVGVSTIANDNTEGYLNEVAVQAKRTIFYARALRGGKAARIFRVIPGTDACKACLSLYFEEKRSPFIAIPDDPSLPIIATECNNPIRPASAADLKLIASLTTKLVLEYLEKGDQGVNHWIWSTEALSGLLLTPEIPYRLQRQFLAPHPDCPVCAQRVPVPILLSDQAKATIVDEVKKVKGIETGGILIGFETKSKEIVVLEASGPGPKAIMTLTRFERDVEYCQKKLEQASVRFGSKGLYIGEWHFHPQGRNEPSPLDISSLYQIAVQKNYATYNPVMIIADAQYELAGTVHAISTEILPTQITLIPYKQAMMKEALLRPV